MEDSTPMNEEVIIEEDIMDNGDDVIEEDLENNSVYETEIIENNPNGSDILENIVNNAPIITDASGATLAINAIVFCADRFAQYLADTTKFVAQQETQQVKIRAERDKAIAKIDKVTNLIRDYLDKTFDERKSIFNKQFDVVDEALRKGDIQMLHLSLASINQLAAQSPFKNLADIAQVQSALMDDDTVWDI